MIHILAILSCLVPSDASTLEASVSALKSSISALDSAIDSLESGSGFWESVGWWSALAVGLGVLGELAVIVRDFLEDKHEWSRGIVRPPDRPSVRWLWFDVIATFVVIAGIFLEAGANAKVSSINSGLRSKTSELRAKSDQLLSLVTQQAGSAEKSANSASVSASIAKHDADAAESKAEGAIIAADKAGSAVDAVAAKSAAIASRLDAASKKMAAIEGEVRLQGPRSVLLEDGKDDFIGKMGAFKGQKVSIGQCQDEGERTDEGLGLAMRMIPFLTGPNPPNAGWIRDQRFNFSCRGIADAIVLSTRASKNVQAAASALASELKSRKMPMMILPIPPEVSATFPYPPPVDGASPFSIVGDPNVIVVVIGRGFMRTLRLPQQ